MKCVQRYAIYFSIILLHFQRLMIFTHWFYSNMLIYTIVVLLFFTNKLQHMNDLQVLYYPYSFLYLHTYVKQHDVLVTQTLCSLEKVRENIFLE